MFKEQKIATYSEPGKRIQLLKITNDQELKNCKNQPKIKIKYQIRRNRKITHTCFSEYVARKKYASIITGEILQQKFSF